MKPTFAIPSVPYVKYFGNKVENNPVNITLCLSFSKGRYNRYPDNEGIPSIEFHMLGDKQLSWRYPTAEERDKEFKELMEGGE